MAINGVKNGVVGSVDSSLVLSWSFVGGFTALRRPGVGSERTFQAIYIESVTESLSRDLRTSAPYWPCDIRRDCIGETIEAAPSV